MAISLYDLSVPTFLQTVKAIGVSSTARSGPALNATELNNMTPNMTASEAQKDPELN